ncbi:MULTISPECIES: membrane protein insertion efficiency factor YidD [unclassified Janthinobacterium]|uniref:membrane protein insertion efficiency factor YidD n=1 Tax=unclassified Janthinobacterium TaxID=2610881 RepID=UPI00161907E6|nr:MULTISPECIES: membrane protein insertion efficiency factor YidD [unclassified Janthinobacterium]MBB5367258.1 putative component of membrane protein insertase Oxa1/YidC/SpoIIIJ protein YidD [Janthinobacterium sp. K2C7]MBB5380264.1 putative component of membrane protein insertase Oxa1/YidC/SpoIIIJ protein YidD [Janthinobacterium sp. K2Li3]MBB5385640.1 putative component of membrane protein insertase Oxa1/YidC/SpoIIIJ protein YidD [Janthinobacterium sp. K2E3]
MLDRTRPGRKQIEDLIFTLSAYSQHLALWAIRAYQRYLSPYKGFSCAYRVRTGRDSCSGYGYRVIARHGLIPGWALLRRRLHACGAHHRAHLAQHPPTLRTARHRAQAGHCDVPTLDCGDCSCSLDDLFNAITPMNCDWSPGKKRPPFRNSYTTSQHLKQQQVEHRQKIARMQEPEN